MRKATIILTAILMAVSVSGQVKGVDLENLVEAKTDADLLDHIEEWVYVPDQDAYVFMISTAPMPVDYKHLITELNRILEANDLDIDKPDEEDDLLPPSVSGLTDYSDLDHEIAMGEAEIMRKYYVDDEWFITIYCNYNASILVIAKFPE